MILINISVSPREIGIEGFGLIEPRSSGIALLGRGCQRALTDFGILPVGDVRNLPESAGAPAWQASPRERDFVPSIKAGVHAKRATRYHVSNEQQIFNATTLC